MAEILIVDDAEENIVFLSEIVEEQGHPFRVARNGKEALLAMRDMRPDLVLLDIMMPRKSGVSVLAEMKKDESLAKVPVIVVTGTTEVTGVSVVTGEQTAAKEDYSDDLAQRMGSEIHEKLGSLKPDGLVEKPIDPPTLVAEMDRLLA